MEFNTKQDAEKKIKKTKKRKHKKKKWTQQPVTKDRKTARVEGRARDHPVRMTGATEREEKRRER